MPKLECLQQLNESAHFFAFSLISIDRRMASLRPILSRFSDNARALKFPFSHSPFLSGRLWRDLLVDYLRRQFGGASRVLPRGALLAT